ncbi:MAG TPA: glycosyltransferase family 2 protein, partial [Sphingomonadaceae bacterium]|nr:glycosyltransferase family 2 protein [Sphingomonadaceae bacterium]
MPPDRPSISIVTASFNALGGLRTTVGSVAEQDFDRVEHIVIDGGSSDGTREYLESLGDSVRWVSEPDAGIADALNKGFALARGEYVLVLQAEDTLLEAGSISQALPYLARGADIVAFPIYLEDGSGKRKVITPRNLNFRSNFRMPMPHQGVFFSRELFERLGGFDTSFG